MALSKGQQGWADGTWTGTRWNGTGRMMVLWKSMLNFGGWLPYPGKTTLPIISHYTSVAAADAAATSTSTATGAGLPLLATSMCVLTPKSTRMDGRQQTMHQRPVREKSTCRYPHTYSSSALVRLFSDEYPSTHTHLILVLVGGWLVVG